MVIKTVSNPMIVMKATDTRINPACFGPIMDGGPSSSGSRLINSSRFSRFKPHRVQKRVVSPFCVPHWIQSIFHLLLDYTMVYAQSNGFVRLLSPVKPPGELAENRMNFRYTQQCGNSEIDQSIWTENQHCNDYAVLYRRMMTEKILDRESACSSGSRG